MKVLIAVLSCHSLRHYEQSIRDTWGAEVPPGVDLRFFLGTKPPESGGFVAQNDEILLDVEDDFENLTYKMRAMCQWALIQGYDFTLKVDLDTLVQPKRFLESGFDAFDWTGGANSFFASGGAGNALSKRAMGYIVEQGGRPGHEEDVYVAYSLLNQGIQLHADPRYLFTPGAVMDDQTITYHLSSIREWWYKGYRPEMMYEAWADQKARNYRPYPIGQALFNSVQPIRRTFRRQR
jgi:hypothetical protein